MNEKYISFANNYLKEEVDNRTKAYWLSPSREVVPVMSTHIDTVLKNLEPFGLTQDYIDTVADKHGGKHELRDGGKARDEIMTDLLRKGWVRIRKVESRGADFWTIQIETGMGTRIDGNTKRSIIKWAESMYNMNPNRKNDTVVVLNTKGEKLFGGGQLIKDQKTINDIILDDTGVFESVFSNNNKAINESSLSRVWSHNEKHDCGAITAFRGARDCGDGKPYTSKENMARNKSLLAKLQAKGYGVTTLNGKYPEGGVDKKEISFFVVDLNDNENLLNDLRTLGEEFEQDSVLFIPKSTIKGEDKAYLIGTNKCENNWLGYGKKELFNKGKMGYDSPIYTSYVNGRPFIFECVEKENKLPQNGTGMLMLHRASEKNWRYFLEKEKYLDVANQFLDNTNV